MCLCAGAASIYARPPARRVWIVIDSLCRCDLGCIRVRLNGYGVQHMVPYIYLLPARRYIHIKYIKNICKIYSI